MANRSSRTGIGYSLAFTAASHCAACPAQHHVVIYCRFFEFGGVFTCQYRGPSHLAGLSIFAFVVRCHLATGGIKVRNSGLVGGGGRIECDRLPSLCARLPRIFHSFRQSRPKLRILTDSNVDWGQGLLALRDYERKHPDEQIHLAYFGSVNPSLYGIREIALPEGEKAGGTVVIGASMLSGDTSVVHAYLWVLKFPRVAILDDSL